jgi:hypothetical protein
MWPCQSVMCLPPHTPQQLHHTVLSYICYFTVPVCELSPSFSPSEFLLLLSFFVTDLLSEDSHFLFSQCFVGTYWCTYRWENDLALTDASGMLSVFSPSLWEGEILDIFYSYQLTCSSRLLYPSVYNNNYNLFTT